LFTFNDDGHDVESSMKLNNAFTADAGLPTAGVIQLAGKELNNEALNQPVARYPSNSSQTALNAGAQLEENTSISEQDCDRKLLQALFDGDNISSVYDHHYVDPTNQKRKKDSNKVKLEEKAQQVVDQKLQNLCSSTSVYVNRANHNDQDQKEGEYNCSSDRKENRFGQFRSTGDSASSSKAFLSSIESTNKELKSSGMKRKKTIREDIRERLEVLFNDYEASKSSKNKPLSSEYILSSFQDLGDQYAPLFKDILRSVAVLRDGCWYRK